MERLWSGSGSFFPDDPALTAVEQTGFPDGTVFSPPQCPVCGAGTDTWILGWDGRPVGCPFCTRKKDAWEELP